MPMQLIDELPPIDGFRFMGVSSDGAQVACVLREKPENTYSVIVEETDAPCEVRLVGWLFYWDEED